MTCMSNCKACGGENLTVCLWCPTCLAKRFAALQSVAECTAEDRRRSHAKDHGRFFEPSIQKQRRTC